MFIFIYFLRGREKRSRGRAEEEQRGREGAEKEETEDPKQLPTDSREPKAGLRHRAGAQEP